MSDDWSLRGNTQEPYWDDEIEVLCQKLIGDMSDYFAGWRTDLKVIVEIINRRFGVKK